MYLTAPSYNVPQSTEELHFSGVLSPSLGGSYFYAALQVSTSAFLPQTT